MATVTVNPNSSAFVAEDDDFGFGISPDNALHDILPADMKEGIAPPRAPRSMAAAQTNGAQPANGSGTNQPGEGQPSTQDTPAGTSNGQAGGTNAPAGQPGASASVIEIAGEQPIANAANAQPSGGAGNAATQTTVNTTGQTPTASEENVIVIAPGQKLRTPKGDLISSDEVINQEALRPKYDKTLAEKNKAEKELAEAKTLIAEMSPWVDAAQKDKLLANALTAVRNGAKPVDAIRGAAIQAGLEQEFSSAFHTSAAPTGPPQPGTPDYFRETDLAKLGIEAGSEQHAEWWKGHVAQNALDRVEKREREIDEARQKRESEQQRQIDLQKTQTEEKTREATAIRTENKNELDKLPKLILEELQIDVTQLSASDCDRIADAITRSASKLTEPLDLVNESWLGANLVRENDLRLAISKAGIRMVSNGQQPMANGQAQPAGNGAATNGQKPTQQMPTPTVQSKVNLDPSRPLQPGPQSEGTGPMPGSSRGYSDDKAYMGALIDTIGKG